MRTVEWEASISTHNCPLEGAMKLKIAPFRSSFDALTDGITKFSPWTKFIEEQHDANFSFVAPFTEY